jgi:O-antigen ligase
MKSILQKIYPWSLFSIGLVLVVRDQLIAPFILLAILSSIPYWKKPSFSIQLIPVIGLMLLFYWYLIGMVFSENLSFGWKDIESKLSFFLFPFMFLFTFRSWDDRIVNKAKEGLIAGVIISMILSFGRALVCKWNGGEICFRNDQFGFNMHATYLSVIYLMSVVFMIERNWRVQQEKLLKLIYLLVVLIAIYFMRSLSSFMAAAALASGAYLWYMIKMRKWIMLSIIPILLLLGTVAIRKLPAISGELKNTYNTVQEYRNDPDEFIRKKIKWNESNTVRIVVWNFSSDIIAENPMGVGTGDVKDRLFREYRAHGYDLFAEKGLNAHNQFFQSGIAIGLGGIILLLCSILGPIFINYRKLDPTFTAFVILMFITCLFESYLERQAGIIFFSFFLTVMVAHQLNKGIKPTTT